MHELSIASAILEKVQSEAVLHPGVRFTKVGVKIGELSGVDPDALSFGWEALLIETPMQGLALEIEYCPRRQRCDKCGTEFEAKNSETVCPKCGQEFTVCIGGEELNLAYIETEDL